MQTLNGQLKFRLGAKLPSGVKTKTPAFERGGFESCWIIQR